MYGTTTVATFLVRCKKDGKLNQDEYKNVFSENVTGECKDRKDEQPLICHEVIIHSSSLDEDENINEMSMNLISYHSYSKSVYSICFETIL